MIHIRCNSLKLIARLFVMLHVLVFSLSISFAMEPSGLTADEQPGIIDVHQKGLLYFKPQNKPIQHIGYSAFDSDTGEFLDDPSVRTVTGFSPKELDEIGRYSEQKINGLEPTRIIFRSGHTIRPEPGISASVKKSLAAGEDAFHLIQFTYPFPTESRRILEENGVVF